jgi:hypothetical protein
MVLYNLSEGRLEEGNREKGFEVGFWGLVFSDIRAGRTGPPGFRDPLRARIESRAVFFAQKESCIASGQAVGTTTRESPSSLIGYWYRR